MQLETASQSCAISRVCEVILKGDKTFSLRQQKYKVSDTLKTGEAVALFGKVHLSMIYPSPIQSFILGTDYLADSVDAFLTSHRSPSPTEDVAAVANEPVNVPDFVPLGLTFSFPVEQTALNSGRILTWTKGFAAKNAIGNDVVKLLQDAFDRKHMHVKCVALVNDVSYSSFVGDE